jgi:hypothetical protein
MLEMNPNMTNKEGKRDQERRKKEKILVKIKGFKNLDLYIGALCTFFFLFAS